MNARRSATRKGVKTIREARKEAGRAVHTMRLSAEECRRICGETIAFDQYPGGDNRVGYWIPTPVGIVAALTPFNDPLNLVAHKVGPASPPATPSSSSPTARRHCRR